MDPIIEHYAKLEDTGKTMPWIPLTVERRELDNDPLAKLSKVKTKRLSNLLEVNFEDDETYSRQQDDPEFAMVEQFLASA